jgi:aminoglycoside phosphotransferase (APT) family kinase protein
MSLTHRDYWPGNTVWYRRRLTGIVDWSSGELGDPRVDISQCRVDLALMYGDDWADEFQVEYEKATNARLSDLRFWDLYGARGAMTSLHYFWQGYQDLGLLEVTMGVLRARLDAFIRGALDHTP